jgi:hypothetical protein
LKLRHRTFERHFFPFVVPRQKPLALLGRPFLPFLSFPKTCLKNRFCPKYVLFSMPVAKPFVFVPPPWRGLARPAAAPLRSSLPATKSPMAPTKRVSAHPQASEASDSGDSELLGIDESRSVGSHEAGQAAATKRRKPCPENIGDGAETRCFEVRLCEEEEPKPALDEATARDEAPNESLANDFVC